MTMPVPSALEGFDVPGAVARMLDQPTLWWQALGLFVQHFSDWEPAWQASLGDAAEERRRVHALRSAAANVGAERLAASAAALEDVLLRRVVDEPPMRHLLRQRLGDDFRQTWRVAAEAWQKRAAVTESGA